MNTNSITFSDNEQITDVVTAAYDLLAFAPGELPQWSRFRELFIETAVLALRVFPADPAISILSFAEYMTAQLAHGLQQQGYSETPGERTIVVVNDVASVQQEFTMNFAGREPVNAIDIFALVRTADQWRIASVLSDMRGGCL